MVEDKALDYFEIHKWKESGIFSGGFKVRELLVDLCLHFYYISIKEPITAKKYHNFHYFPDAKILWKRIVSA